MFENHSWDGDKNNAAGDDEEYGGGDADLSLTDLLMFLLGMEAEEISGELTYLYNQ